MSPKVDTSAKVLQDARNLLREMKLRRNRSAPHAEPEKEVLAATSSRGPVEEHSGNTEADILAKLEAEYKAAHNGRTPTAKERAAMKAYLAREVEAKGPGATPADLDRNEVAAMCNFVRGATKVDLLDAGKQPQDNKGPVGMALDVVPDITSPIPPMEKPKEPPENASKEEKEKYEKDLAKYERQLADEKDSIQKVTSALATGALTIEKDPDRHKDDPDHEYRVRYMTKDGVWKEVGCKDPDEAKKVAKLVANGIDPKVDEKGGVVYVKRKDPITGEEYVNIEQACEAGKGGIPSEFTKPLSDNLLAAVATGDIVMRPSRDGGSIEYIANNVEGVLAGDDQWHSDNPEKALESLETLVGPQMQQKVDEKGNPVVDDKGNPVLEPVPGTDYQSRADVNWKDIDGQYTDEDKKKLFDSVVTNPDGTKTCPACGAKIPADKLPKSFELMMVRDAFQASTPAIVRKTDTSLVRKKAVAYRRGYEGWEAVSATDALVSVVLQNLKKAPNKDSLDALFAQVIEMLGDDPKLARAYVTKVAGLVNTEPNPIRATTLAYLVTSLRQRYAIAYDEHSEHFHARPRAGSKTCPVCGSSKGDEEPMVLDEVQKSQTAFKGDTRADKNRDFAGIPYKKVDMWQGMLRDGSQQGVNPFTHPQGIWTKFSFRPSDKIEKYPLINIVPASFKTIASFEYLLNNTPYVIVAEYFMRNNVAGAISLFNSGLAKLAETKSADQANKQSDIKTKVQDLVENIAEKIGEVGEEDMVINIPFVLYHRLKGKVYGNRYIFPYIPKENYIAKSSNDAEWGSGEGLLSGLGDKIQGFLNGGAGLVGVGIAKPFPAPTWKLPESGSNKWQMQFTLNLINDDFEEARNNYMCANTIINNNRWIQKSIIGFPGALYEVTVPTGVRELMCTGDFSLKSIGVPRQAPKGFFVKPFPIGSIAVFTPEKSPMHDENYEVIPDVFELTCKFTSAIDENLNNSVFSYYLNIAQFAPGETSDSALDTLFRDGTENPGQIGSIFSVAAHAHLASDNAEEAEKAARSLTAAVSAGVKRIKAENQQKKDDTPAGDAKNPEGGENPDGGENPEGGDNPPAPTPEPPTPEPAATPALRRAPDFYQRLVRDAKSTVYRNKYAAVEKELKKVRATLRELTHSLIAKQAEAEKLAPSPMKKAFVKRVRALSAKVAAAHEQEKQLMDQLVELEMQIFLHSKDQFEHRVRDDAIEVPREYFVIPEIDEVEALKIRLMTRSERARYIAEKNAELAKLDKYGITSCDDFLPRACVGQYILDLILELERLIRDSDGNDDEARDHYMYRKDMLWEDLKVVFNPKIPFVLNKTNLVYVPLEYIPTEWLKKKDDSDESDSSASSSSAYADSSSASESSSSSDLVPYGKPEELTEYDKQQLMLKHRNDVIRMKFGDEDGLSKRAYQEVVNHPTNKGAKVDKEVLVILKLNPALTNKADIEATYKQTEESLGVSESRWGEVEGAIKDRQSAIRSITQDLYRYVSSAREVLLGNALNEVDTVAKLTVDQLTQEFKR